MSSRPFITTNLDLAAYLCAVGNRLQGAARQGKFFAFRFDTSAASDVEQFLNGATAPAQGLLEHYRELRTLIINKERAEKICHKTALIE